jgi:glutaryl-CoA dehydrogenase (non-decarboxylating)
MKIEITEQHKNLQRNIRHFVEQEIKPLIAEIESEGRIPGKLISKLAREKYLGYTIEEEYGGLGMDAISVGLLHEEMAKGHCSVENMLTVFGMVIKAIYASGNEEHKKSWLPKIAAGEAMVAFAMTEPDIGSDIKEITTFSTESGDNYILNGVKKWITLGQIADLFVVFTKFNDRGTAFLVERNTPGLEIVHMPPTMGLRANMLAELRFKNCILPRENILRKIGTGFTRIAAYALDEGRYTTACGNVGLAQACLDASLAYANKRKQFGAYLKEHNLVQKMLTEMIVNIDAARLLCNQAGSLRDSKDSASVISTLMAKYFASKTANLAAGYAVQIHGAMGCSTECDVERYYRDAKIMEIIEGTSQIYEIHIAKTPIYK